MEDFFEGREWLMSRTAVERSVAIEEAFGKKPVFQTVTNKEANEINLARIKKEFNTSEEDLIASGKPSDPSCKGGHIIMRVGMQVRVTQNLDKDRGQWTSRSYYPSIAHRCLCGADDCKHSALGAPRHDEGSEIYSTRLWVCEYDKTGAGRNPGLCHEAKRLAPRRRSSS